MVVRSALCVCAPCAPCQIGNRKNTSISFFSVHTIWYTHNMRRLYRFAHHPLYGLRPYGQGGKKDRSSVLMCIESKLGRAIIIVVPCHCVICRVCIINLNWKGCWMTFFFPFIFFYHSLCWVSWHEKLLSNRLYIDTNARKAYNKIITAIKAFGEFGGCGRGSGSGSDGGATPATSSAWVSPDENIDAILLFYSYFIILKLTTTLTSHTHANHHIFFFFSISLFISSLALHRRRSKYAGVFEHNRNFLAIFSLVGYEVRIRLDLFSKRQKKKTKK